jgi:hypothetical protein
MPVPASDTQQRIVDFEKLCREARSTVSLTSFLEIVVGDLREIQTSIGMLAPDAGCEDNKEVTCSIERLVVFAAFLQFCRRISSCTLHLNTHWLVRHQRLNMLSTSCLR